jgi:ADP-ribose pyrophosphatase YjhB (NUDIX family)
VSDAKLRKNLEHETATSNKHQFIIGVFAVIFDSAKRVLLCHRTDIDLWNLPSGALEQGETPWAAAVREVEEEVGLVVEIERLLGVYSRPDQNEVAFGFLCRVVEQTYKYSDEADDIQYFEIEKIPSNTNHEQVEALQDAIKEDLQASLKLQAGPSPREIYFRDRC